MRSGLLACGFLALAACAPPSVQPRPAAPPPDPETSAAAGAGFYATRVVAGETPPANEKGVPVRPKVTSDFAGSPATNDWWSSLIWAFDRGGAPNPYSEIMFPHPLAVQAERRGLAIAYPTAPVIDKTQYRYPFEVDLRLGAVGLDAPDTRVARYSDWTVTAAWGDGDRAMRATLGHGLPFVYVESTGGRAARVDAAGAEVWRLDGEVAGVTVHGHSYGLFAPPGARWRRDGDALVADLGGGGRDFYSVAVLPDREPDTLALFRAHAYAFVTGGQVAWEYQPAHGEVITRFHFATTPRDGREARPIVCLYRHQWQHTDARLERHTYVSPRGEMKVAIADEVTTRVPFRGVVPVLPVLDDASRGEVRDLVDDAWRRGDYVPTGSEGARDSYWIGKALERLAILIELADQVGHAEARAAFLRALENELEDWFDGRAPSLFFYDRTWRTLIGSPSAYGSSTQLNDHHFHYGYFVFAAATVARLDPAWAARYAPMVELLVRDVASWDRGDERFPFLRYFDPYAGHSWASGPAAYFDGNNEESSSEDVNFAVGAILWGTATGNTAIRDLGVFLHANLAVAIGQYWFDVDGEVFPSGFERPAIAILWGNGGRYHTWWDPSPVYVHGINALPITGGSLYLGQRPDYVKRNWRGLVEANRGEPLQWRDVLWMYLALGDADGAARRWRDEHRFTPEFGNSSAAVEHWIDALASAGLPDGAVSADAATAVVLRKGDVRTYVAYNPGSTALTVRFSDGTSLPAPARALVHVRRPVPGGRR